MKNNTLLIAIVAILALVVVKFAFFSGYNEKSVEKLMKKSFSHKNYSVDITMKSGVASNLQVNCNLKRKNDVYVYEMSESKYSMKFYMDMANDDVVMTMSSDEPSLKMLKYAFVGHISDLDENYSVDKLRTLAIPLS